MLPPLTKEERKMTRIGTFRMEIEKPSTSKALAFGLVATLMILIMLLAAKPAQAATITVNTNADDSIANNNCTVREAITRPTQTLQ